MATRTAQISMSLLLFCLTLPLALYGQSEAALSQYFLGRMVVVKMDMPATKDGVDVFPGRQPDINYNEYSQRIKRFGISLHSGDRVPITKIHLKDRLLEFQLAGGGYGTAGDESANSTVFTPTPKSGREKGLEDQIKRENDPREKRHEQDELNRLRQDRQRQDAQLQAAAQLAQEQQRQRIFERAQQSGSRFNLKYPDGLVAERITPDVVMQVLTQYVDFNGSVAPAAPVAAGPDRSGIHKGMLQSEVDALLGRPVEVRREKQGTFDVSRSTYEQDQNIIEAVFVESVLVQYSIRSK